MSENVGLFFISQFLPQAPMFLVYVGTLIVALLFMRRAPLASSLALAGTVILLTISLALPLIQWFMIRQSTVNYPAMSGFIALGTSCIRAVATSLLVCAIFVGRRPATAAPPASRR